MRTIAYLSQVIVTDDTVAELVIDYARSLALNDTSDTVSIPTVGSDGTQAEVELLLGPASQMMSGTTDSPQVDLDAAAAIAELRRKIGHLTPHNIEMESPEAEFPAFDS
ncbi:hypothetical protein [Naasia lichenicola]|uniref:Uncharacterized protein n=1 Tax=Naasia lichenicola TaxID=2565933 RepID=A0A4S4FI31_9MICO|nr:hypothetical protein [Naasia lichenicola]THG29993.1 hypothetical protein E6C64_15230 [Naasia lichenicola]